MASASAERKFDIAVAAAADSNYTWPAVLSLLSAATHCKVPVICLLVGDRLDADLVHAVRGVFERRAVPFKLVDSDLAEFEPLPTGFHFSRATYGRLRVVDTTWPLAPRTLYLDADTLVIGDISSLAGLPLATGNVLAAARAPGIPTARSSGGIADWEERNLDPDAPFFNAGVLLIDNEEWRRDNVSHQVIEQLSRAPDAATFADQGALNAALQGRWTELASAWNCQVVRAPAARIGPFALSRRYQLNLRKTRILHFFQSIKPWDRRYPPGALTELYRDTWAELLPVPVPITQTWREWLRERH